LYLFLGGAFSVGREDNPFNVHWGKGAQAGSDYLARGGRIISEKKHVYDEVFMQLNPVNGKVSGSEAKKVGSPLHVYRSISLDIVGLSSNPIRQQLKRV